MRALVSPFVFRRYLDYSVFDALRVLHRQIREHAAQRSAANPQRANDVKLSRGGIREVEFIVQLLQVVRGGQFPELRTRPTLSALQRLATARLLPADTALELAQSYVFLRQVEHRIQYLDDQQTHVLPTDEADLQWIAQTLGLADSAALLAALHLHRERVAKEFDGLLGGDKEQSANGATGTAPATRSGLEELLAMLDAPAYADVHTRLGAVAHAPTRGGLARRCPRTAVAALAAHRGMVACGRSQCRRLCGAAGLDGNDSSARKLSGAAAGATPRTRALAAPAGCGALASALSAETPGRDRRARHREHAGRTL